MSPQIVTCLIVRNTSNEGLLACSHPRRVDAQPMRVLNDVLLRSCREPLRSIESPDGAWLAPFPFSARVVVRRRLWEQLPPRGVGISAFV